MSYNLSIVSQVNLDTNPELESLLQYCDSATSNATYKVKDDGLDIVSSLRKALDAIEPKLSNKVIAIAIHPSDQEFELKTSDEEE